VVWIWVHTRVLHCFKTLGNSRKRFGIAFKNVQMTLDLVVLRINFLEGKMEGRIDSMESIFSAKFEKLEAWIDASQEKHETSLAEIKTSITILTTILAMHRFGMKGKAMLHTWGSYLHAKSLVKCKNVLRRLIWRSKYERHRRY
jgi:hypothetical protein